MRLTHLNRPSLLAASAVILAACAGGGENNAGATTGATSGPTTGAVTTTPPAGQTGAAGAAGAQQPTGQTHTVRMVGDPARGTYSFDPARITIRRGDAVKWVMVSGGPHDVDFDENGIPTGAATQLAANMPKNVGGLSSPMMVNANEEYTVSFAGVPAGAYNYVCKPHLAMNMRGTVTVQ